MSITLGPGNLPASSVDVRNVPGQIYFWPSGGEPEAKHNERKNAEGWGHLSPESVFIAAIGNHWAPGAWNRVVDMFVATKNSGVRAAMFELMDRCHEPYDALGTMRNEALLMAMNQGFEWICYLDNDIWPEPDFLLRLLRWQLPIVAPFVAEPGTGKYLGGPGLEANTGVKPAKWTVLSMLLFKTAVFNCTGPMFWHDAIGADEGIHFQKLWHYGHRLWVDTGVQLQVGRRPIYPLSSRGLPLEERLKRGENLRQRLLMAPDRRPIDPNSPHVKNGIYLPFEPPKPPEAPKQETIAPAKQEGSVGM